MSRINEALLKNDIQNEAEFKDFIFNEADNEILHNILQEINQLGYNLHYLSELEYFKVPGSGEIIAKYIKLFSSESTKSYLVPQLVSDKVKDCDKLILELYKGFKLSNSYVPGKGERASANIYVRYDNAFRRLKSKRIKNELVQLVINPRDMHYLPLTTRMLSSWKVADLKSLFCGYLNGIIIRPNDVGLPDDCDGYYPPLEYIREDIIYTSIACLKNYPDIETIDIISRYIQDDNKNIGAVANNTLKAMKKVLKII